MSDYGHNYGMPTEGQEVEKVEKKIGKKRQKAHEVPRQFHNNHGKPTKLCLDFGKAQKKTFGFRAPPAQHLATNQNYQRQQRKTIPPP